MREFGIVALLSVIATAAAPTTPSQRAEAYSTAKTTAQFVNCYTESQKQQRFGARLWYAANREGGGALSNLGAPTVRQPYFIQISDHGTRREILLRGAAPGGPEARGVGQCI